MNGQPPSIEYRTPQAALRASIGCRVVFALAVLCAPVMRLTALAAFDGFFNPHSDFVFRGWAILFCLSCIFPAISLTLRWLARR